MGGQGMALWEECPECLCVCVSSTFISHIEYENLAPLVHGNVLCEPVSTGMQNVPVNHMYTQTWVQAPTRPTGASEYNKLLECASPSAF